MGSRRSNPSVKPGQKNPIDSNTIRSSSLRDYTPRTRYVKSGEVHIAYQVLGDGPIDLLWVPGFVSHLEYDWEHPRPARFFRRLASFSRLIRFDKRGTGLSDRVAIP